MTGRQLLWLAYFGLILTAWAALWAMGQGLHGHAACGPDSWLAPCRSGAADIGFAPLAAMWALMAAAMMAPTFAPALRVFLGLPAPAGAPREAVGLIAGYLAVWLGASLGFAALQRGAAGTGLLAPDGRSLSDLLTAGLLLAAGLYQFSRLKSACLSRCRAPLTLFIAHWHPGPAPAFGIGLRLGADCLGCCWALMLLAFVGGMTNLLFMGLATLVMVLEKLPEIGRPLTRPLGLALLIAGVAFTLRALGG